MTFKDIQNILTHLDGRALRSVTRPASGLSGSISVLETDHEDLILKTYDEDAARWKPGKERVVFEVLGRLGIPAPQVLLTDCSGTLTPTAYSIARRISGTTISAAYDGLSDTQRIALYAELGDTLGRMHALTFDRYGDLCDIDGQVQVGPAHELADEQSSTAGPFETWLEMHHAIVERHLRFLSRSAFADLTHAIRRWFRDHDGLIDYPITPRLLHMDLHCGNVLVEDGRITGILDVEESIIGHNEYDLMRTELAHFRGDDPGIQEAFFDAYARHVTLDDGYEERQPYYELSRMLVGLRCIVTYESGYASDLESASKEARERVMLLMAG